MTAPRMFGLEMLSDPYPIYERLRAAHPVFYEEELRAWLVTSYDAVNSALRSPQFSSERYPRMKQVLAKRGLGELVDDRMRSMLHMDAPDHTRLRSLVNKAFTPRIVEAMEGRIQQLADHLLNAVGCPAVMAAIEH